MSETSIETSHSCQSCFQPLLRDFCLTCDVAYIKCLHCKVKFETFAELKNHLIQFCEDIISCNFKIRRKNGYLEMFVCPICATMYENLTSARKHRSMHELKNFKCSYCDKTFLRRVYLSNHLKSHTDQPLLECEICDKKFYVNGRKKSHLAKHHKSELSYTCSFCSKVFSELWLLKRHIKQHSEEKLFKCEYCGKSFHFNFSLKRHEKTHQSLTPFECDNCQAKFSRKSDIQRHMMKHLKIYPFQCSVCDKKFIRKNFLTEHMNSHGMARNFLCFCGKTFKYLSGFSRHKKKHEKLNSNENMVYDPLK